MRRYSDEALFELARELDAQYGEELTGDEFCRKSGLSRRMLTVRFGGWHKFRKSANLPERPPATSRARRFSRDVILQKMHQAIKLFGSNITSHQFCRHTPISQGTVRFYFESWGSLREAAGLDRRIGNPTSRVHTCERLRDRLWEVVQKRGSDLTSTEFHHDTGISLGTIEYFFGTWQKLRDYAGIGKQPPLPKRLADDELLADLHHVATWHGRFPSVKEYHHRGQHSRDTLKHRFGGKWKNVETRYRNWLYQCYPAVEQVLKAAPSGGIFVKTADLVKLTEAADCERRRKERGW